MGWDKQKGKDDVAYIFTAIWEVDKIGDGEKPDGIPDKYQKKITFKVVNGLSLIHISEPTRLLSIEEAVI